MNDYSLGADGITLCHHYEQCRLESYPDPASPLAVAMRRGKKGKELTGLSGAPWTVGFGDTKNVSPGMKITQADANERFERRMNSEFVPGVRDLLRVEITQKQFDALVDFAYNAGLGNLRTSTLLRLINAGDFTGAVLQLPRWNKAGGLVLKGLERRRYAEAFVFVGGDAMTGIRKAERVFP